jgi:glycosyltransferase involved in cell wall biosynthesis
VTTLDVFGWMADRSGCGYLRVELPLTTLRARGHTAGFSDRIPLPAGVAHINRDFASTVVAQRTCNPGPTQLWQATARYPNRPRMVFEVDDDLWDIDASNEIPHRFFGRVDIRANLTANLRVSDAVTVTTEPLAEVVAQHTTAPVHIIPNYLPAEILTWQRPSREDTITIGWGGSATHAMDFAELAQPLRRYLDRAPVHVEFHTIGADYSAAMKLPRGRVRATDWVATPVDFWQAIDFDIAVMPLRPHPFNQAKSSIKAQEAAALGIPVVASDVGPYARFVRHGETGYLVKQPHEWAKYLRALVEDDAMRTEMGANARRQAAAWTIEGNINTWEKVLAP